MEIIDPKRTKERMDERLEMMHKLYPDAKPTNADRIRSMTGEEMADAFHLEGCPKGKAISDCLCDLMREPYPNECKKCWLEWLQQESEGE